MWSPRAVLAIGLLVGLHYSLLSASASYGSFLTSVLAYLGAAVGTAAPSFGTSTSSESSWLRWSAHELEDTADLRGLQQGDQHKFWFLLRHACRGLYNPEIPSENNGSAADHQRPFGSGAAGSMIDALQSKRIKAVATASTARTPFTTPVDYAEHPGGLVRAEVGDIAAWFVPNEADFLVLSQPDFMRALADGANGEQLEQQQAGGLQEHARGQAGPTRPAARIMDLTREFYSRIHPAVRSTAAPEDPEPPSDPSLRDLMAALDLKRETTTRKREQADEARAAEILRKATIFEETETSTSSSSSGKMTQPEREPSSSSEVVVEEEVQHHQHDQEIVLSGWASELISVNGFPLIGRYKVVSITEQAVTLQPACVVRQDELRPGWELLALTELPEGIRNSWMRQRARERAVPVHGGGLEVEGVGKVTAVAPEKFFKGFATVAQLPKHSAPAPAAAGTPMTPAESAAAAPATPGAAGAASDAHQNAAVPTTTSSTRTTASGGSTTNKAHSDSGTSTDPQAQTDPEQIRDGAQQPVVHQEYTIVRVMPTSPYDDVRKLLNTKVKILGENTRIVAMGLLTLSGMFALRGDGAPEV
eukprot:CAMPEP_0179009408 /NCGR_PEP_ID=MMETSP0795-20121207/16259_1 /TAXON_ID=88552 /ORGANISM="Amoebophrya sp., Strain Ameob2" /LENGTH=589 /DNA_ID=CAMNT_0020704609 /DNA_START=198 /DNA_END=1968 /DNA_ORIENTATION=-